jgi:hypothetical protein
MARAARTIRAHVVARARGRDLHRKLYSDQALEGMAAVTGGESQTPIERAARAVGRVLALRHDAF